MSERVPSVSVGPWLCHLAERLLHSGHTREGIIVCDVAAREEWTSRDAVQLHRLYLRAAALVLAQSNHTDVARRLLADAASQLASQPSHSLVAHPWPDRATCAHLHRLLGTAARRKSRPSDESLGYLDVADRLCRDALDAATTASAASGGLTNAPVSGPSSPSPIGGGGPITRRSTHLRASGDSQRETLTLELALVTLEKSRVHFIRCVEESFASVDSIQTLCLTVGPMFDTLFPSNRSNAAAAAPLSYVDRGVVLRGAPVAAAGIAVLSVTSLLLLGRLWEGWDALNRALAGLQPRDAEAFGHPTGSSTRDVREGDVDGTATPSSSAAPLCVELLQLKQCATLLWPHLSRQPPMAVAQHETDPGGSASWMSVGCRRCLHFLLALSDVGSTSATVPSSRGFSQSSGDSNGASTSSSHHLEDLYAHFIEAAEDEQRRLTAPSVVPTPAVNSATRFLVAAKCVAWHHMIVADLRRLDLCAAANKLQDVCALHTMFHRHAHHLRGQLHLDIAQFALCAGRFDAAVQHCDAAIAASSVALADSKQHSSISRRRSTDGPGRPGLGVSSADDGNRNDFAGLFKTPSSWRAQVDAVRAWGAYEHRRNNTAAAIIFRDIAEMYRGFFMTYAAPPEGNPASLLALRRAAAGHPPLPAAAPAPDKAPSPSSTEGTANSGSLDAHAVGAWPSSLLISWALLLSAYAIDQLDYVRAIHMLKITTDVVKAEFGSRCEFLAVALRLLSVAFYQSGNAEQAQLAEMTASQIALKYDHRATAYHAVSSALSRMVITGLDGRRDEDDAAAASRRQQSAAHIERIEKYIAAQKEALEGTASHVVTAVLDFLPKDSTAAQSSTVPSVLENSRKRPRS